MNIEFLNLLISFDKESVYSAFIAAVCQWEEDTRREETSPSSLGQIDRPKWPCICTKHKSFVPSDLKVPLSSIGGERSERL